MVNVNEKQEESMLESALRDYMACALWTLDLAQVLECTEFELSNMDNADVVIAEDSIEIMRRDVKAFIEANISDIMLSGLDLGQVGHDLWLTRNGHGAGFWDRGLPKDLGDRLTEAARLMGSQDLYVISGDDEKIVVGLDCKTSEDGKASHIGHEPEPELVYSNNGEVYCFHSEGELTQYFIDEGYTFPVRGYRGKPKRFNVSELLLPRFDFQDELCESAFEEADEFATNFIDDVMARKEEVWKDLIERLSPALEAWAKHHGIIPKFFMVVDTEEFEIEEPQFSDTDAL